MFLVFTGSNNEQTQVQLYELLRGDSFRQSMEQLDNLLEHSACNPHRRLPNLLTEVKQLGFKLLKTSFDLLSSIEAKWTKDMIAVRELQLILAIARLSENINRLSSNLRVHLNVNYTEDAKPLDMRHLRDVNMTLISLREAESLSAMSKKRCIVSLSNFFLIKLAPTIDILLEKVITECFEMNEIFIRSCSKQARSTQIKFPF